MTQLSVPGFDQTDPLGPALLVALAFHALLILGLGFDIHRGQSRPAERTIDITMVAPREAPKPVEDPQFLAQSSQEGGGEELIDKPPTSLPSQPTPEARPQAVMEAQRSGSQAPSAETEQTLLTTREARQAADSRPTNTPVQARPRPTMAQLLASTQQEITQLTEQIDRQNRLASSKNRRKAINASTQEYKYAAYLQDWRNKVERIGNLNYPDEAKRQRLTGDLLLHVAVRSDGSVADIRLVRSSGHKVLDDAAIRIVRLAAPFSPFPPEIRKEVDILDITRTWQFRSGNQLSTSN